MPLPKVFADRYRLTERLGSGAFGEVYAAFDEGLLQRPVAVKLGGAPRGGGPSEVDAARFVSELRLAGALRHPHIAAVYDAGLWEGQLFMVVELVRGVELGRFLEAHAPLPVDLALRLAGQLLDAVAWAHEQGVVHHDLKPGNLLIDDEHRLVVVDFGLATSQGQAALGRGGAARAGAGHGGAGSPGYTAPEQLRGGAGGPRSDQFSIGAVLYLLLTGVSPFVGKNLPETLRRTLLVEPPPPSSLRADLPVGLDRAVLRALSKDPAARYPDLRALSAELLQHAAFTELCGSSDRLAALGAAVRRGGLVLLTGADPRPWIEDLRLSLALSLAPTATGVPPEGWLRDPRQEAYPTAERPLVIDLGDDEALDRLALADDGLEAALRGATLLLVELPLEHPPLRRLLRLLRGRGPAPAFAVGPRWGLEEVRAAERLGVSLIERPPGDCRASLHAELPPLPRVLVPPPPERPFKFLSYFDAEDEAIYFGRSTELARLTARILARPIALLYGASGSGKTSLLRAGLAPKLRRAGHRLVLARVFDDPLGEICHALGLHPAPGEDRALAIAGAVVEGSLLIVVVDQLEELFVRFPRPAREAFAVELGRALAASGGRLRLLFSLRADYLARLMELRELLPLSLEGGLYLESLSAASAREAVVAPAALLGVGVEPALLDQLVGDLFDEGIDPPQLQLLCDALWEAREPGGRVLTLEAYRALGEARSILTRHLGGAIEGLPAADRGPVRALLKAMVTTSDTRSVRPLPELARAADLPLVAARRHIEVMSALRLVRPLDREDGEWFELTHEVLAVEVGRWLTEQDRRLSQVRELLEQGRRGHEQLGLLLSPAQLRLIAPLEHRLELGSADRRLLQLSRGVLSARRRGQVTGALLTVALLLGVVVGGRSLWLSRSAYAQATEARLSWFLWDDPREQAGSTITVYRGVAEPWWTDRLLGYPREPYQTDWRLEDMSPALQEGLRAGLDLPSPEGAVDWLRAGLGPVAAARERLLEGDLEGLDPTLRRLSLDPAVGPAAVLSLAPMLALGEAAPDAAFPALFAVAEDRAVAIRAPGGGRRLEGRVGQPMGLLLLRADPLGWRPQLQAALAEESGPELVGELLAAAGGPEDIGDLAESLGGSRAADAEAAVQAVSAAGDCAHLAGLRRARLRGSRHSARDLLNQSYIQLTRDCGDPADIDILVGMLDRVREGELEFDLAPELLRSLYRLAPARAPAELARVEASATLIRETSVTPWGFLGARDMVAALRPGSAEALHARLYLLDPSAVWPSWELAHQAESDPFRVAWLAPLALFEGQALQDRAIAALRRSDLPVHQALPLLIVAARRGDAEAARAVGTGLASADLVPLQTALNHLTGMPGPLPSDLGGAGRQAALGRAVVALRRGEPTPDHTPDHTSDLFREVLEDADATYLELLLATEGQRRRWALPAESGGPDEAVQGLRSPSRRVRLAALLALAGREEAPALSAEGDPALAATLRRLRWARAALAEERALRVRVREELDRGRPRRAQQIVRLLRSTEGPASTINAVLSPDLPGVMSETLSDELVYLQVLAEAELGMGFAFEWMILYVPPSMWPRYAVEPHLAAFSHHPLIGVLAGSRPPAPVEDP